MVEIGRLELVVAVDGTRLTKLVELL